MPPKKQPEKTKAGNAKPAGGKSGGDTKGIYKIIL